MRGNHEPQFAYESDLQDEMNGVFSIKASRRKQIDLQMRSKTFTTELWKWRYERMASSIVKGEQKETKTEAKRIT